ncbi:alkaline phosphatase family protein [Conexivisphaera calida]|uniref:2,3-bisphosphoglycerate-independent phosphoglycerate mutase, archaeal type n=1 Tax=Conexivisphaera calida TaxID=1874277 RepID=A0A4P2VL27_9ARCH|nr:alkaline phosphatase family protein [Conexivisphaera calida]BBE41878.1 2,3-bisphosphoglycerate-independent phosphoglycerate mutase, archaeal type [Conexivisphaera calida]
MRKLVYVLLDGVGDRPDPRLGMRTPLEAAATPNLDSLATRGSTGLVYTVGRGIAPESDVAVFHMLGYRLGEEYPGRGVIEAVGSDIDFRDGDLALRANFATVDERMRIVDRRAGRDLSDSEAKELAAALNREVKLEPPAEVLFRHTVGHRLVVRIRVPGVQLSSNITNTDPAYKKVGGMGVATSGSGDMRVESANPLDGSHEAALAAQLVNEVTEEAYRVLNSHPVNVARAKSGRLPANMILMRDAGSKLPRLPSISELHGLDMAAIADMPVEVGVARIVRMDVARSPELLNYGWKASKVMELLQSHDGVYVHLKGPDEPGHDGLPEVKTRSIELIDSGFFGPLLRELDLDGTLVAVSADHSTPCQLKSHSEDPVPLLVSGGPVRWDGSRRFTEPEAARGSLGILEGPSVLPTIIGRYLM